MLGHRGRLLRGLPPRQRGTRACRSKPAKFRVRALAVRPGRATTCDVVASRLDIPRLATRRSSLALERELGCQLPALAQVLVRRGLTEPSAARAFLVAADCHDPTEFDGMDAAVELILRHVAAARGSRSTATTTSTGSPRPRSWCAACATSARRRLVPAVAQRGRLRAQRPRRSRRLAAERGTQAAGDDRLRHHVGRGGRACAVGWVSTSS